MLTFYKFIPLRCFIKHKIKHRKVNNFISANLCSHHCHYFILFNISSHFEDRLEHSTLFLSENVHALIFLLIRLTKIYLKIWDLKNLFDFVLHKRKMTNVGHLFYN